MYKVNTAFLIDDDPIYVGAAKYLLKSIDFCHHLRIFENGKKALDELVEIFLLKKQLPDIIFLDINMPVMDGWQFLDELSNHEESKNLIIYIVSSSNDPEDIKLVEMHGKKGFFINKPLDAEKLKFILTEQLKNKKTI
jgi:CheY-like chemotaxis protein